MSLSEAIDNVGELARNENNGVIARSAIVDVAHILLTFSVGENEYGLDVHQVLEITGVQQITPVPDMPDYVRGLTNMRGRVIPLVDMRVRFNMEERALDERTCAIVVQAASLTVGLIVDSVNDVIRLSEEQVEKAPQYGSAVETKFAGRIAKVGDSVKLVLDLNDFLSGAGIERLRGDRLAAKAG